MRTLADGVAGWQGELITTTGILVGAVDRDVDYPGTVRQENRLC